MGKPYRAGQKLAELLERDGMSQERLSQKLGCTRQYVNHVVSGRMRMSPQMAIGLERVFEYTASYWLALQSEDDLEIARQKLEEK